ncbi:MAG: hypothetical protein EZS28_048100 [Streblomastix strix]|uniref:Uncharacterized protein n=1 Tax=Streblomastix strix TaxID=222440 RepID=A0A5J4TEL8_9EUKA|nr:MAG: hypothetical protein EZS28_048100 [Streblomastix strix]
MVDTANQGDVNTINNTGSISISTYPGQINEEKEQEITTRYNRRAPDINKKRNKVSINLAIAVGLSDEEPGGASCFLGNNALLYMRRALKWCESVKMKDSKNCGTKRGVCGIFEPFRGPTLRNHPLITSFMRKHSQYKISRSKKLENAEIKNGTCGNSTQNIHNAPLCRDRMIKDQSRIT